MAHTDFYDGGFPLGPTRQMIPVGQNTQVNILVVNGNPQYLKQSVQGADPSGFEWIALTRSVFGFSLWASNNASIRFILYTNEGNERDYRGWRLYKNQPNVVTGYEIPPHQFKLQVYADVPGGGSQLTGFVWVRSL